MALPTKTLTYDNLNSSTTADFDKKIVDGIFKKSMLLNKLNQKKRVQAGGNYIEIPYMYAKGSGGSFIGQQTLSNVDKEIITALTLNPAFYEVDISISDTDQVKNQGPAKIYDLLEAKYMNAQLTMQSLLAGSALYGDGTIATYGPAPLIGLALAVATANTTTTYAGITRDSSNTYGFNNQVYSGGATATAFVSDLNYLQTLWGLCSDGDIHPDIIVTNQTCFNWIWARADARQQLGNEEAKKLGMTSIDFNGVPLIVDKNCPDTYLYMLNTDYLYFKVYQGMDMAATPFLRGTDRLAQVKYIKWGGQLVCSNPRYQGVYKFTS